MRSFLTTAIVGIILSISTIAYPADSLFSNQITDEEIAQFERSAQASKKVTETLDLMQKMMMLMQFQRGACDEVESIERKAIQGDAEQQYWFGGLYLEGLCVGKNQEKAVEWIRKAADQDNLSAQFDMGIFCLRGDGVQESSSTAAKWFLKCAEKGEVRCQRLIGNLYAEGQGVPKNTNKAVLWLEKAALQNDEASISTIAAMYIKGASLSQDFVKAEQLLSLGAERGQARNQLILAILLSGKSMGRYSPKEAYKWSNLATQSQNEQVAQQAVELRTQLEGSMTLTELAEAQSMSSKWKPIKDDEFETPQKKLLPKIAAVGKISKKEARTKLTELGMPITRLAFFRSIEEDNFEVFELFVKAGADLNTERVMPRGVTPLYWAIDFGSQRIIEYLLDNGADINKRNQKNGMTPLVRAIAHKRWDVVDRLLDMGASAKQTKETHPDHMVSILSGTPLGYSLMYDKPELVKRLIEKGASVDELYIYHRTPLINAVQSGYPNNVKVLLNAGADPNARSDLGETALLSCFIREEPINHIIVELLLKAGASIEYPSSERTPLFEAVIKGDAEAIRILAKYKYNINERYAITRDQLPMNMDNEQIIDLLNNGGSPLMVASLLGNYVAAKTLVELGADLRIVVNGNNGKYTVKNLAVKSGNSMLINYLNKY
jgi:TPR repeat protein/ankyrin repeat protein